MKEEAKGFFSAEDEARIVEAIRLAELKTSGEIRVHLENHANEPNLKHAEHIFHKVGMDKTALRNGVLFYLAVQDHQFSIVGDKGINEAVHQGFWDEIRDVMQSHFRESRFTEGLVVGIGMTGTALKQYFPREDDDINELSNEISKS